VLVEAVSVTTTLYLCSCFSLRRLIKLTALKQLMKKFDLFDFMSGIMFCVCFFNLLATINIIVIQTSVFNDSKQYLLKYTFTIG